MDLTEALELIFDRPIAFHPIFADIGGSANAGLFLSQAFYWSKRTGTNDGWFWKTQEEWEVEIKLSRREQEHVRKILREKGFLIEEFRGIPRKLWFKLDKENISSAILFFKKQHAIMHESAIMDSTKAPLSDGVFRHANSEITTETTSEITKEKKKKNIKKKKKEQPSLFNLEETEVVKGKHTIPSDFYVNSELVGWASEHVPGIDLQFETDKFRDYHRGKQTKFIDWNQAWRNWMRNAYQYKQERQARQVSINPSVNRKVVL